MRIGINGFGRMGRLALRAAWSREDLEVVAVNEPNTTAETMALLLEFDSVQGRWDRTCVAAGDSIDASGKGIAYSRHRSPAEIPWADLGVGLVLECSGRFKKSPALEPHFERGASRVVVSAPVKDGPPNIVLGVNHDAFDLASERIVTAASCTTNCLAPLVRVLHDGLGIVRRLRDDDPCADELAVRRGRAARRPAPGARLDAQPHPDVDQLGHGGDADRAGAHGEAR